MDIEADSARTLKGGLDAELAVGDTRGGAPWRFLANLNFASPLSKRTGRFVSSTTSSTGPSAEALAAAHYFPPQARELGPGPARTADPPEPHWSGGMHARMLMHDRTCVSTTPPPPVILRLVQICKFKPPCLRKSEVCLQDVVCERPCFMVLLHVCMPTHKLPN